MESKIPCETREAGSAERVSKMQINGIGNDNMQNNQIYKTPTRRRSNVVTENGTARAGVDFKYSKEGKEALRQSEISKQNIRSQDTRPSQNVVKTPKLVEMEQAGEYTQNPYASEVAATGAAEGEKSPLIIFWEKVRLKLKTLTDYFSNHFSKHFSDNLANHFSNFFGRKNEASAEETAVEEQNNTIKAELDDSADSSHENSLPTDTYDSSGRYKKNNFSDPTYTERI